MDISFGIKMSKKLLGFTREQKDFGFAGHALPIVIAFYIPENKKRRAVSLTGLLLTKCSFS